MLARYDINCSCMVILTFVLAFETHMLSMKGYVTIIAVDYVTMNAVIISLQSTDVLHMHYFCGGSEASQFFLLNFIASIRLIMLLLLRLLIVQL